MSQARPGGVTSVERSTLPASAQRVARDDYYQLDPLVRAIQMLLSVLHGPPPKMIWIRLGNCSTDDVIRLLRVRRDEIEAFVVHEEAAFLALA